MKNILTTVLGLVCAVAFGFGQNIVGLEYFYEEDPGVGNGIFFPLTPSSTFSGQSFSVSTAGLPAGRYAIGVRLLNEDGEWGIPAYQKILVHEVVQAEYFWNVDPGIGQGVQMSLSETDPSFSADIEVDSSNLPAGDNLLGVRMKSTGGIWSQTKFTTIKVEIEFSDGEYFWDVDPGNGNATGFSLPNDIGSISAEVSIDNFGLSAGLHRLYTRVRGTDGIFGPTKKQNVYIVRQIAGGEYFWDVDPGVGNGTPLNVLVEGTSARLCEDIGTVGLSDGEHYLYVRTVGQDGTWSIPKRVQLIVEPSTITVGCSGDFDRNGEINVGDLLVVISNLGTESLCSVDLTGDFKVDIQDLLFIISILGSSCE